MDAIKLLRSQGFGSRSAAKYLIDNELVSINGEIVRDPKKNFQLPWGLQLQVGDETLITREFVYLALNKPENTETSHRPQHHDSVFDLLPERLLERNVQAVGRLDADTTGLLLFSDDGQFIHRVSSGKRKCIKEYIATLKHAVTDDCVQALLAGVLLNDEPEPVRAVSCHITGACEITMEIDSGKYHQVKRMVAAAGNRVEALHRSRVGGFALPADLAAGQWRYLTDKEVAACLGD